MSGNVTDVAGNVADLSKLKIVTQNVKTVEEPKTTTITNVKSPKTGDESTRYICILLEVGMVMMVVEYCYRKNKRDK